MNKIIESRISVIKDKVFTLKNIRDLANVIWNDYQLRASKSENFSVSFSIYCTDASTFQSGDITIFNDDSTINSKRVYRIMMDYNRYYPFDQRTSVAVSIYHGGADSLNTLEVKGNDSLWVNGIIGKLKDAIDATPPQHRIAKKYMLLIKTLVRLGVGLVIFYIMSIFFSPIAPSTAQPSYKWEVALNDLTSQFPIIKYFIKYSLALLLGFFGGAFFTYKIDNSVSSLWPSVEIQVGPEHTLIEKKRRKILYQFLALGVLPFLISLIYDFIKGVF